MGLWTWLARRLGLSQVARDAGPEAPRLQEVQPLTFDTPRSAQATPRPSIPQADAWEADYVINQEEQYAVELPAWLHYRDGKGQESQREIRVRRIAKREDGSFVILAFCQVRQANRSFVASRIVQFVDLTTGEVVAEVGPHLMACYWASPAGQLVALWERRTAEFRALLFVAKADGALRIQQRAAMLAHLQQIEPGLNAGDDHLKAAMSGIETSQRQFRADLKAVTAQGREIGAALLAGLEAVAATRKSKRDFTDAAMVIARKALRSSSSSAFRYIGDLAD